MLPAVKRRLVTHAAAASLLLCIATMALWVRSYQICDRVGYSRLDNGLSRHSYITGVVGEVTFVVRGRPPFEVRETFGWRWLRHRSHADDRLQGYERALSAGGVRPSSAWF